MHRRIHCNEFIEGTLIQSEGLRHQKEYICQFPYTETCSQGTLEYIEIRPPVGWPKSRSNRTALERKGHHRRTLQRKVAAEFAQAEAWGWLGTPGSGTGYASDILPTAARLQPATAREQDRIPGSEQGTEKDMRNIPSATAAEPTVGAAEPGSSWELVVDCAHDRSIRNSCRWCTEPERALARERRRQV
jgi:hypothetical protein